MKLLFGGDFCTRSRRSLQAVENSQFDSIVGDIRPIIMQADFSIVNMENPIVLNKAQTPVYPEFVQLGSDKKIIECLKYAGFNLIACANNHAHDYDDKGVIDTINALKSYGASYVGIGNNSKDASNVYYTNVKDIVIGVVNFCENEFSVATPNSPGTCGMDTVTNYYQIKEARSKADIVIVFIHGGVEHYSLPTPNMKKRYHFYVDLGCDIVVNCHQHCYSGYEYYKGKPIIYGLGNLFFDIDNKSTSSWNAGYLAEIDTDKNYQIRLFPYEQGREDLLIRLIDEVHFGDNINKLNEIISDDCKLEESFDNYIERESLNVLYTFLPYNRIYRSLLVRKIVPLLMSRKNKVLILNYLRCESRREKLVAVFSKLLNLPLNRSI